MADSVSLTLGDTDFNLRSSGSADGQVVLTITGTVNYNGYYLKQSDLRRLIVALGLFQDRAKLLKEERGKRCGGAVTAEQIRTLQQDVARASQEVGKTSFDMALSTAQLEIAAQLAELNELLKHRVIVTQAFPV